MLTLGQRRTLQFVKEFFSNHDYAPTTGEIAQGIGIKSRGVVHRYLKALDAAGAIKLIPNRHRNIKLVNADLSPLRLQLVGAIAAGQPIEAINDYDDIDVGNVFLGDNRYALRVKGDSMIEEGIFDGDIIVCEHNNDAQDGQIVVALIDEQEATLKRILRPDSKTVMLIPANSKLTPMVYESPRVQIQGIYIGLLRLPKH